jgi:hypothetical protein
LNSNNLAEKLRFLFKETASKSPKKEERRKHFQKTLKFATFAGKLNQGILTEREGYVQFTYMY